MGFIKKLLGLEPKSVKLLGARIVTGEDHRYYINLYKFQPNLRPLELVRLNLHYYAEILFRLRHPDAGSEMALMLKKMMQTIVEKNIHKDSNILRDAGITTVMKIASSEPRKKSVEIIATLFFIDKGQRKLSLELLRNPNTKQLMFSVLALIHTTLVYLDQEGIAVLNRSLAEMNAIYDSGQSFSDMNSLTVIPTKVFISALKSDR